MIVAFIIACAVIGPQLQYVFVTMPPASAQQIPMYPNSHNPTVTENSTGKLLTFETSDSQAEVLAYYATTLQKDGWGPPYLGSHYPYPANVFDWYQAGPEGPTDLGFQMTIQYSPARERKCARENIFSTVRSFVLGFALRDSNSETSVEFQDASRCHALMPGETICRQNRHSRTTACYNSM